MEVLKLSITLKNYTCPMCSKCVTFRISIPCNEYERGDSECDFELRGLRSPHWTRDKNNRYEFFDVVIKCPECKQTVIAEIYTPRVARRKSGDFEQQKRYNSESELRAWAYGMIGASWKRD
jgi:hypothetical protein